MCSSININRSISKFDPISELENISHPHFAIPLLNCYVNYAKKSELQVSNIKEYSKLSYQCSLPVPIDVPATYSGKWALGLDRVTKLVQDKRMWESGKDELIAKSVKLKRHSVFKTRQKNIKKISHETVKLAEHLNQDPDPNFKGFYNWYYSNGSLSKIFVDDRHSILYVNDSLPGTCIVTPANIDKSECVLAKDSSSFLRTGHKQHIYQISTNSNFIALRQRNRTSLFTFDPREFTFKKIHKHLETKDSIVSVAISNSPDPMYCCLTTSYELKLWSPEVKNEYINCVKVKNRPPDRWGSVKFTSNNNILVSTRSYVYLKDIRMPLEKYAQKWKTNVYKTPCDFVSLIVENNSQTTCAYVGTTHYLYELDFRKGLSKLWKHMLEFPPMYGEVNSLSDSNETLLIGSQSLNEVCAIDTNLQVMPYILHSPDETRNKLHLEGLCLDPEVSCRFNFSMVGMTVLPNQNDAFVLRSSSVGDIFCQKLNHSTGYNDVQDECINFESFSNWEKDCARTVNLVNLAPLEVTSVVHFDELKNAVSEDNFYKINDLVSNTVSKKRTKSQFKFPKCKKCDPFTQSLVDVWNFEEVDEQVTVKYRRETHFEDKTAHETPLISIDRTKKPRVQKKRSIDFLQETDNVVHETTMPQRDLPLEDINIPLQSVPSTDVLDRRNNSLLFCDEFDVDNHEENSFASPSQQFYNSQTTTPVMHKQTTKLKTTKTKPRFSSGF